MGERVLFVDDDQMLLSSIERCLGLRYAIDTALSGPEALRLLEENEAYAVVVTDMRMPVMDGVEFLRRARAIAPHTVYLMLTGNQDLETASRAVNEGRVFQLLNKPCDPDEIAAAVDLALRKYDLNRYERETYRGTYEGALAIAGDVIEILRPDWTNSIARSERIMERLRGDLGLEPRRELSLAARLAPLGFALLPVEDSERYAASRPGSPEHDRVMNRAFATSALILGHLPQLGEVAEMIRHAPAADGSFTETGGVDDGDRWRQGAALLRAAYLIDGLLEEGVGVEEASARIAEAMPAASSSFLQAIAEAYPDGGAAEGVTVEVDALVAGMVLLRDLRSAGGERLMSAGRRLGDAHIAKLQSRREDYALEGSIEVTRHSYDAAVEEIEEAVG